MVEATTSDCAALFTPAVEKPRAALSSLLELKPEAYTKSKAESTWVLRANSLDMTLLHVRLPALVFDHATMMNPALILNQALRSSAMMTVSEANGFDIPLRPSGPVVPSGAASERLLSIQSGATLEDIAVKVASRFHGVVLYRECVSQNGKKVVTLDFFK